MTAKDTTGQARPPIGNLQVERVPIDSVRPHPENARRGNLDAIAESLREHGQFRPLVVQRSAGNILAGNHTWLAAKERLHWKEIDVTYVDVDDDRARRILLADNRLSDLAEYDDRALVALIGSLEGTEGDHHTWAGFEHAPDLAGTGFDDEALERLVRRVEPPAAPGAFSDPEDGMETVYRCPGCGYEWSGLPKLNETGEGGPDGDEDGDEDGDADADGGGDGGGQG